MNMKNNLYVITLILFILSFALADYVETDITSDLAELQYWSWMNCRETLKKYSLYRESTTKINQDNDDEYFDCTGWSSIEYREKCEKKYEPLSDITKSFFHECAITYQGIRVYRKELNVCGKEIDTCEYCRSDEGKSAGCKTIESKNSDQQVDYTTFKQNLQENCQINTKCPDNLGQYAQEACQVTEKNQCKVDWLSKYSPQDPCLNMVLCKKSIKNLNSEKTPIDGQNLDNSFSIIPELPLLILLALFLSL